MKTSTLCLPAVLLMVNAVALGGGAIKTQAGSADETAPNIQAEASVSVDEDETVFYSGGRAAFVKLPPDFDPSKQHALLVVLHGFNGSAYGLMADGWTIAPLVVGRRLIIVAPEGTIHPYFQARFWNAMPWCCGWEPIFGPMVDDSGYLAQLIDDLLATYPLDPDRIYVAGASNGGAMAYRFALDYPQKVAAVVSHGGVLNFPAADPAEPVSVLHIHGSADTLVNYHGGQLIPDWDFTEHPGARETVTYWAGLAGCQGPLSTYGEPLDLDEVVPGAETERERFRGCRRDVFAELWTMHGSGHDLDRAVMSEEEPTTQLALAMWDWLRTKKK